ncbi:MAG: glycosyltransferase [Candidatus Aenigmarchaeota archaeon]|nr:glycosyltransferase [Candidatus Aenigmarchaeota archaeon]
MKIVHVTKYFSGSGGIESYTRSACKAAIRAGHKVSIICSSGTKKYSRRLEQGMEIIELPELATAMNAPITNPMIKFLESLRPDIIHLHIPNPWAELNVFLYKIIHRKTKIIATYHSDVVPYGPIMNLASSLRFFYLLPSMNFLCDKIIATSPNYVAGSLALRMSKGKVHIIPIGVDIEKFKPGKNTGRVFTFLFVGRLIPYKGLDVLIKACGILKGSGKRFIVNVVGDGKLYKNLLLSAARAGVKDRIKFMRKVGDSWLPSVYRKSDVFILPSLYRSEAFGLAQLEAMASGKPVISTEIKNSGVSFVNENGVTGIVVKPNDEISLANAMMKLMDDKKLRLKMGASARKRAEKVFDEKNISKRILKIYEY